MKYTVAALLVVTAVCVTAAPLNSKWDFGKSKPDDKESGKSTPITIYNGKHNGQHNKGGINGKDNTGDHNGNYNEGGVNGNGNGGSYNGNGNKGGFNGNGNGGDSEIDWESFLKTLKLNLGTDDVYDRWGLDSSDSSLEEENEDKSFPSSTAEPATERATPYSVKKNTPYGAKEVTPTPQPATKTTDRGVTTSKPRGTDWFNRYDKYWKNSDNYWKNNDNHWSNWDNQGYLDNLNKKLQPGGDYHWQKWQNKNYYGGDDSTTGSYKNQWWSF